MTDLFIVRSADLEYTKKIVYFMVNDAVYWSLYNKKNRN